MNRYPLWKYILIGIALVVGLVYTVPNLFGEVPAVQVSPVRATLKSDAALLARVEDIIQKNKIVPQGTFLDATGVKVRLEDPETQIRARDVLQSALGDDYVVALNLLSRNPQWLASIGALPMYLGLDLRGGVHFLLQVDMKGALAKRMEAFANDFRTTLRDKRIQYAGVTRDGLTVNVRFRDRATRDKALAEIERAFPDLQLRAQDDAGESRIGATLRPEAQTRTQDFALQQNITTLRNRVNELGVAEPIIQQQGADRVVVQLPGVQDTAKAKDILGRTATLEVRMVDEEKSDPATLQAAAAGTGAFRHGILRTSVTAQPVIVRRQVVLTGDRINDAQPGFDNTTNEPRYTSRSTATGARIFQQVTRENVGKRMAILLFEKGKGEVVTAPVIRQEIGGGRVQISGRMSTREASDVALLLRAGALAAPMDIIEERTVGPSLGAENIRLGFRSMWYGFAAIAFFMIVYYATVRRDLRGRAGVSICCSSSRCCRCCRRRSRCRVSPRSRSRSAWRSMRTCSSTSASARNCVTATRRRRRSPRGTTGRGTRFSTPTSRPSSRALRCSRSVRGRSRDSPSCIASAS